jgi:cysteine desulfurase
MGIAADHAQHWLQSSERDRMTATRERFEHAICEAVEGAAINGAGASRNWNTSNIAFTGLETESILLMLSEKGVYASGGSACASGSLEASPVLAAMHLPAERANASVRFSFCRHTTDDEIDRAVEIITGVVNRLRATLTASASKASV